MSQLFRKILLGYLCFYGGNVAAQEALNWQDQDYKTHYVDINGDGRQDLLMQPLTENQPGLVFSGEISSGGLHYTTQSPLSLPLLIDQQPWFASQAQLVSANFDGDEYGDVLLFFPKLAQILIYAGTKQGIDFTLEPSQRYSENELPWLAQGHDFDFYAGDFNGDGKQDLLALSQDKQPHYLMHTDGSGRFVIAQEIDKTVKWGKKRSEKLLIRDYNADGKDDVFALAKKQNQSHYLVLADEVGQLSQSRKVPALLQGKSWNSDDFSVFVGDVNSDNTLDFIRLNNMPGGIDELGNYHASLPGEDVDDTSNACDQLFFSATGEQGSACLSGNSDSNKPQVKSLLAQKLLPAGEVRPCEIPMLRDNQLQGAATISSIDCEPPRTPSSAPSISGSATKPAGTSITVNLPSLSYADYHEVFTSENNSSYRQVKRVDFGTQTSFTIRSSWGYQYVKYKTCNLFGCSGLSPWQRVLAYTSPGKPNPSASPASIQKGQTAKITWSNPGYFVWSGSRFQRKYTTPSGASISLSDIPHTTGANPTSFTTATLTAAGSYKFYVRACNPTLPCGSWGVATVTVVNQKPSISPTSPANNTSYLTSQSVTASASASDSDGSISRVEFRVDSGSWQSDSSSPYSKNLGTLSAGSHKIYYRSRDNDGAYSSSTPYRTITVKAPNIKPTVSPISPASNASYLTNQSVTASASASDSDGSITQVEFKLDSGSWQSDSSSPYSKSFGTLSAGSHRIYYRAKDNSGEYSSSTPYRTITVKAPNIKPTVSPTSPTSNASYLTSQSVVASASASDSDGSISRVEFKLNSGSWQSDSSSPYSKNFGTLSAGSHRIYYRAKDNSGEYSSSTPYRNITVTAPNNRPLISPISPAANADYPLGETISASASAGDSDGSISRVEFKLDGGAWSSDSSSPYNKSFAGLTAGSHILYYRAIDNKGLNSSTATRAFTVSAPLNKPPVIEGPAPESAQVGLLYLFTPSASDEDEDALTFSITDKPAWLTFDSANGKLTGTPAAGDIGTFSNIIISVNDGTQSTTLDPFTIVVAEASSGNVLFIHTDVLGSPVAETDEQGNVL